MCACVLLLSTVMYNVCVGMYILLGSAVKTSFVNVCVCVFSEDIQSLTNWIPELRVPSTYQDSEVSVTNSECSDAPSIEIDVNLEDALLQNLNSTDFLSSAVVTNNQGTCSLQSGSLTSLFVVLA